MAANVDTGWDRPLTNLSIHQINCSLQLFKKCTEPAEVVDVIVKTYNASDEDRDDFEPLTLREWSVKQHKYDLRIYYCRRTYTSHYGLMLTSVADCPFESDAEEPFTEVRLYYTFFLYRKREKMQAIAQKVQRCWEVFALTTGDAWNLVKSYADFRFPIKVAMRCVDPKLVIIESKTLAGRKGAATEAYRDPYALQENELDSLWKIFKLFKSRFKLGSSLYQLPPFKDLSEDKEVGVEIGRGKVQLKKPLSILDYLTLLEHFGKVSRGEETYASDGKREETDPSFRYLENIRPVSAGRGRELERTLVDALYDTYWKSKGAPLSFRFCHRYYRDFYRSSNYTVRCRGYTREWHHHPPFSEVIAFIHQISMGSAVCDSKGLFQLIDSTFCEYDKGKYKIIEFFEGELRTQEGGVYFRNEGIWFEVHADHLCAVQSAFYTHVVTHLMDEQDPGHLPHPWVAADRWAAFTFAEAQEEGIPERQLLSTLEALQKGWEFSFVNTQKKARLPYVTRAVLEKVDHALRKKVKKNWEEINEILSEAHQSKTALSVEVFRGVLGDGTAPFFEALQKKYSPCIELKAGKGKKLLPVKILDEEGHVLRYDLSQVKFDRCKVTFEKCREWIQQQLKNAYDAQKPLDKKSFVCALAARKGNKRNIGKKTAEQVYQALFNEVGLDLPKGEYVMQGPCPTTILDVGKKLKKFLNDKHALYRARCDEEGYNRLYTTEPSYVVCDQVYANKKEKVEMFDILHISPEGKVYLYHVKEGFGQKTRDACAQVRASVDCLRRDKASGNFPLLGGLYDQAVQSKAATPFRKKLKVQLEKLGREGFLDLFKRDSKKIIFVYAFIDSREGSEHLLKDEKEPRHTFTMKELGKEIFVKLKEKKYLDREGRLTATFLRAAKKEVENALEGVEEGTSCYKKLYAHVSQFDSMIAKIELIHTANYVKASDGGGYSFGFQVCQIRRPSSVVTTPQSFSVPYVQESEKEDEVVFTHEGVRYIEGPGPLKAIEILAVLLGVSIKEEHEWVRLYFDLALRAAKEKAQALKIDIDGYAWKRNIGIEELKTAARILDKEVTIFDDQGEIEERWNEEGKGKVFLLNRGEYHYLLYREKEDAEPTENVFDMQLEALVHKPLTGGIGIHNGGNHCFLNATFQMLLHSPFFSYFLEEENISENNGALLKRIQILRASYHHCQSIGRPLPALVCLRRLLGFPEREQQDAEEVFAQLISRYKSASIRSTFRCIYEYAPASDDPEVDTQGKDPQEVSSYLDKENKKVSRDDAVQISLPIPQLRAASLEECWRAFLHEGEFLERLNYTTVVQGTPVVKRGKVKAINREVVSLAEHLVISLKRFDSCAGRTVKINSKLSLPENFILKMGEHDYRIIGFVKHSGETADSGHYTAYCQIGRKWVCFDDAAPPKEVAEADVRTAAEEAYLLSLTRST